MPKKATDHKPFLEVAAAIAVFEKEGLDIKLGSQAVKTIIDHAKWLKKYLADKKTANASRKSFGPKRKPDSEVTPNALRMRAHRDAKKLK